jgi:nucleoside-diphosphate-sugar epimerase
MKIRQEAQELWLRNLRSDDRVLVTGAGGWFGRTAIAMTRGAGLELLATGSKDQQIEIDGQTQRVYGQNLEIISAFKPTVVIDTAFATREMLLVLGHKAYVETNQKLIDQSLAIASMPSVRKYIGFSSGVTMHLAGQTSFSLDENPYAAQKRIYEQRMLGLTQVLEVDVSIARVWSVTGCYVTKDSATFAFTDLITQVRVGLVEVKAGHRVFRRYCAVEDVLALALMPLAPGGQIIFDTGGELVELSALAQMMVEVLNPTAKILLKVDSGLPSDDYHSDNSDWGRLVVLGFPREDSIRDQIARVAGIEL